MEFAAPFMAPFTGTLAAYGAPALIITTLSLFIGGFVKGAVGFALPMIAVTGAASVLPPQQAVAIIIIPAMLSNLWQAARTGLGPLLHTARRFWLMNLTLLLTIWFSAKLVTAIEPRVFFSILGGGVSVFALTRLIGWRPKIPRRLDIPISAAAGLVGGFFGGMSGIWGPPVLMYLIAIDMPKAAQVRAMGLAFLAGAVVLAPAHMATGVLNWRTATLSLAALIPAGCGMALGLAVQDRLEQEKFSKATLIVVCLAALNLLRKAFF